MFLKLRKKTNTRHVYHHHVVFHLWQQWWHGHKGLVVNSFIQVFCHLFTVKWWRVLCMDKNSKMLDFWVLSLVSPLPNVYTLLPLLACEVARELNNQLLGFSSNIHIYLEQRPFTKFFLFLWWNISLCLLRLTIGIYSKKRNQTENVV